MAICSNVLHSLSPCEVCKSIDGKYSFRSGEYSRAHEKLRAVKCANRSSSSVGSLLCLSVCLRTVCGIQQAPLFMGINKFRVPLIGVFRSTNEIAISMHELLRNLFILADCFFPHYVGTRII